MARTARIKDTYAEQRMFARRAVVAAVLIVTAIAVLIGRLTWLQVMRYDYFAELSQGNRIRIDPVPPNRGLILDRNGVALATNRPTYQLELTREQVPDVEATLTGLVGIGLLAEDDIARLLRVIRSRRSFEAVPLRLQLTEEELARFAVRRQDFPGVEIQPRLTRSYPLGSSAVHALGYVSAISEDDKARIEQADYAGTTLIGKLGVEGTYEAELHGRSGFQQILVNAQGRRVERLGLTVPELSRKEPVAGNDLLLTLDAKVQKAAEDALGEHRGAVVALDPANGDVLALASMPVFDPNLFTRGLSVTEYNALLTNIDRPLLNRALRGTYPPGSTIKPLIALAALDYGVVNADDQRFCRGFFTLPGSSHRYRDWRPEGHGSVDMHNAIAQSCDTYFYWVADLIGIDRLQPYLTRFGLGEVTGIDISGERAGLVPSKAWKRQAFKNPQDKVWFPGETVIAGIGQGFMLVTPLQLAHATAAVASRGQRYRPRLVQGIRDAVTGEVRKIPPVELPPVTVEDSKRWDVVIDGMVGVLNDARGTARRVQQGAPYTIAGKSGTAQVFTIGQNERYNESQIAERLRDHGLFVAFAPADAPRIVVAVLVENGRSGSGVAAPIARKVLDAWLAPDVAAPAVAAKPVDVAAAGEE